MEESKPAPELKTPPGAGSRGIVESVDRFLEPSHWQVVVRPIERFGTIDKLNWLLGDLTDVTSFKIRRLDRGVAVFDLLYRGRFPIDTLFENALSSLGAVVINLRPGHLEVQLDQFEPSEKLGFG